MNPSESVKFQRFDEALAQATWRNLYVMVWSGQASAERLLAVHQHLWSFIKQHSDGVVIVSCVDEGSTPPDAEARKLVAEQQRAMSKKVTAQAIVIPSVGFYAAAVMGALTSILQGRERSWPQKVFRNDREAAAWLTPRMAGSDGVTPDMLLDVVHEVRTQAKQ